MIALSHHDREALGRLVYDPGATPSFEMLKCCLLWPDERAKNVSPAGYELLTDLWAVRGFMHRMVPRSEWGLDPAHFERAWEFGMREIPRWPGFKRIVLGDAERVYLEQCLRGATPK